MLQQYSLLVVLCHFFCPPFPLLRGASLFVSFYSPSIALPAVSPISETQNSYSSLPVVSFCPGRILFCGASLPVVSPFPGSHRSFPDYIALQCRGHLRITSRHENIFPSYPVTLIFQQRIQSLPGSCNRLITATTYSSLISPHIPNGLLTCS